MSKLRLTQEMRSVILNWMIDGFSKTLPSFEEEKKMIDTEIYLLIEEKYPTRDMKVLAKYKQVDTEYRVTLSSLGCTEVIEGLNFLAPKNFYFSSSQYHLQVSRELLTRVQAYHLSMSKKQEKLNLTRTEYNSFLLACKTVEDVLEVIKLPESLLSRFHNPSTAVVAVNPEIIARIQKQFKN